MLVQYTWRVDGLPIDQSKLDNGQLVIADDNTLVIENPTHYDTGEYLCTATTKLDSATKVVRISIQDVPNPGNSSKDNFVKILSKNGILSKESFGA